jgi:hypothetical protein
VFKSGEEREAARRARDAKNAEEAAAQADAMRQAEEQRNREAFLATPVGAATAARDAGQAFFEVQLEVARHTGTAGFGTASGEHTTASSAATLEEIEKLGWHLEHAGYYYMITRETSTDRFMATGDNTAVSGRTIGVYLFRKSAPR